MLKKRMVKTKSEFDYKHSLIIIAVVFSLCVFFKVVEDVVDNAAITQVDVAINLFMKSLWGPGLNCAMIFITQMGDTVYLFILSVILLAVLIYQRKTYYSLLLGFGMGGGVLLSNSGKFILHRARPENALITASGYSLPSGHALMAGIFFIVVLLAFKNDIKNKIIRVIFILGMMLLAGLIGFSRIYLGVHWFSDVIAGFSLAVVWVGLLMLIFRFGLINKTN